ncbi:dUTP diphosphatase [Geminicoccus flavidas]|uniref:dUTP diphosphatase n=1 Tax=Geminicoccus flavidas TaxID=2506407 RepID=UPI00135C84DC|nr:dUTP diphosphatase [Geminicoccus flavidas]
MAEVTVEIRRLPHGADLSLPKRATAGAAAVDLLAAVAADAPLVLHPMARAVVPTGIAIALPADHEAQIRPRSGLAAKYGITVLNAPGTIDADYRGELGVILVNLGDEPFTVERGMRIAQMVVAPTVGVLWKENGVLSETPRGVGGFGSTGVARVIGGRE